MILYLHNFHLSLVGLCDIGDRSRRRRKTIKLRGTCAHLVEIFSVVDHLKIIFYLFLSLHVTLFSFSSVLPALSNYPISLSYLSFFKSSYDENCCSCSYSTRKIGVENARKYLVFKFFYVWSLLPLVNPLVEF
jgi:hypothetical protein